MITENMLLHNHLLFHGEDRVDKATRIIVEKTVQRVLEKHNSQLIKPLSISFNTHFYNINKDGRKQRSSAKGQFDPDRECISFALEEIDTQKLWPSLEIENKMRLLAAHEAMHAVQWIEGRHGEEGNEDEAWIEAIEIFLETFPNAQGEISSPEGKVFPVGKPN